MLYQATATNHSEMSFRPYETLTFNAPVYRKTIAGHNEIVLRRVLKRAELRRLLILIDGRRAVDELARCMRSTELREAVDDLYTLGLVEPVSDTPSFAAAGAIEALSADSSLSALQFESARSAAAYAASELLGALAQSYCTKLLACEDPASLREVITAVQSKIRKTVSEDAATVFVEAVRDAARD
jgi:hypothetical protein